MVTCLVSSAEQHVHPGEQNNRDDVNFSLFTCPSLHSLLDILGIFPTPVRHEKTQGRQRKASFYLQVAEPQHYVQRKHDLGDSKLRLLESTDFRN